MDLDTPTNGLPRITIETIAALVAEGHVLTAWSADTHHPRLHETYQALAGQAGRRARDLVEACATTHPEAHKAIVAASMRLHDEARTTTFELSRLKWLLANRRQRLSHEGLPGYAPHQADEAMEAEVIEALLHSLRRGVC